MAVEAKLRDRPGVVGGLLGPAAFIAAWLLLGRRIDGYSPVDDPISRLAAVGAPTRTAMTGGLLAYAAGVAAYSGELRTALGRPVAMAGLVSCAGSIGIAATPLDSSVGGTPHAVAAGITYASLASIPLLAARPLVAQGHRTAAAVSVATGVAAAAALVLSTIPAAPTGLWQRAGLTLGHTWIIFSAARALGRRGPSRAGA